MNELFPVKVECSSGYKADEYPVRFNFENTSFNIIEILDRWYQISSSMFGSLTDTDFAPANYFKVRTSDHKVYLLKQEIDSGEWFFFVKGESINLNPAHQ